MKIFEIFTQLATRSRAEVVPTADVASSVLVQIENRSIRKSWSLEERTLRWSLGVSVTVAAVMALLLFFASPSEQVAEDPWGEFVESATLVMR